MLRPDPPVFFRISVLAAALLYLGSAGFTDLHAQEMTQTEVQARLKKLDADIGDLKKQLEKTRTTWSREQKMLKAADLEMQSYALQLREQQSDRVIHEKALAELHTERENYLRSLDQRKQALARQIMAAYRLGRESRLKLFLNQDSPALMSRTLAYYDYFSRSQAIQIEELKEVLQTLDQMQLKINLELSALDEVQKSLQAVLQKMQVQRIERQDIMEDLSSQIGSGETRLNELQQNRDDLETLLEKLSNVLADIPVDLGRHASPGALKGKMPLPVKGPVKHAFGQTRSVGIQWQGWLIGAKSGADVRAIASGRVAFSDWLRGYGLLMIIDHGDGFMSLYANNESLLYEVGDWVEPGNTISTVGSDPTGGSGLYFEIRKDSKALDPAAWLKR
jgi:septal ring factor EnvC (AmiA/AmiB activator)